jgi:hypothetical protein
MAGARSRSATSSLASPDEEERNSVDEFFRSSLRMEGSPFANWGDEDNIFIRGTRGTVKLLALWSLLVAIGCSVIARDALADDVRLPGYFESLELNSIIDYLSFILCSFRSGSVGREFTAAVLTWHKAMRAKKKDGKGRIFGKDETDKRRNLEAEDSLLLCLSDDIDTRQDIDTRRKSVKDISPCYSSCPLWFL